MSEEYTSSVEGYAEPASENIARRAGIATALGSAFALAGEAVAETMTSLLEQARKAESEVTAGGYSVEDWALRGVDERPARDLIASQALLTTLHRPRFAAIRAAAGLESPDALANAASVLQSLEQGRPVEAALSPPQQQTRDLRRGLERAVEAGANRVAAAQGAFRNEAITATLREMGYQVAPTRRELRPGVHVVRGTSDRGTSIYVAHDDRRGHILADLSGFSGTTCEDERRRFLAVLARHGVKIRLLQRRLHGSPTGGSLADHWHRLDGPKDRAAAGARRTALEERRL